MKKDRKRKRAFQNKPTHSIFLGSSNNIATHHLTQFCLPVENRSLPSGSPSVASRNNYIIQAGTKIDRKGIYLIFLSFNNILRDVHQLTSCQTEYVKRVKQMLNISASYSMYFLILCRLLYIYFLGVPAKCLPSISYDICV